jgi:hypothetical protein
MNSLESDKRRLPDNLKTGIEPDFRLDAYFGRSDGLFPVTEVSQMQTDPKQTSCVEGAPPSGIPNLTYLVREDVKRSAPQFSL